MKKYEFKDLVKIMAKLRSPQGCPWDQEQNHLSILNCLIEEAYEFVDAVHQTDWKNMREELGDLLLQIVFHSQMASESGKFSIDEVIQELGEKLVRRHPHVFGNVELSSSDQVNQQWEEIKQQEKPERESQSLMDGIPKGLPPLIKAHKAQKLAAKVGFDWKEYQGVLEKIQEELNEVQERISQEKREKTEEEIGDLLFTIVNLARHLKIDSQQALEKANLKFISRFGAMEQAAQKQGHDFAALNPDEKEKLWQQIKKDY